MEFLVMVIGPILACLLLLIFAFLKPDYDSTITLMVQGSISLGAISVLSYLSGYTYQIYAYLVSFFGMWTLLSHYRMTRSWRREFKYWTHLNFLFTVGFAIALGEFIAQTVLLLRQ